MSLINEALKKAQRARTEGSSPDAAVAPGAGAGRRDAQKSTRMLAIIGGGALVVVLVLVAITFYFINRPRPAPVVATTAKTEPPKAAPAPAPTPEPLAKAEPKTEPPAPPAAAAEPVKAKEPEKAPAPAPKPAELATPTPAPVATPPAAAPTQPAVPPAPLKPDERIAAFVESVRVTGIRSSGTDSRVLMNERVFRVNDIVDRTLGVRLVKVSVDSLTFADANGVTYVKYF